MKKTYSIILAGFLCLPVTLFAQRHRHENPMLPSFGTIDTSDLRMKVCPFDSDADAERLIDEGTYSYDSKSESGASGSEDEDVVFTLREDIRERIKIFKQSATDRADIKIPVDLSENEHVEDFHAQTYNLDDQGNIVVSKLEKRQIYTQHIDKDDDEIVVTLPDVKPGSVIEYEYTKYSDNFIYLPPWGFQSTIPTRYSYLEVRVPQMFNYTTELFLTLPLAIDSSSVINQNFIGGYSARGTSRIWAMKDIPGLRDEPFMTDASDYLQRIIFQFSSVTYPNGQVTSYNNTWDNLISRLMDNEYYGQQLTKNIPGSKDFIETVSRIPDLEERMYKIYDYVRQNMDWNGDNEFVADDDINKVWQKRSGTSGEINLILIDLLKKAGLDAYPLLVSTRDHGRINVTYPFLSQFNETVAYVWIDNHAYILDGTEKYLPYNLVPFDILNTAGYLVSPDMKGWIPINDKYYEYKNQVTVLATLTPDGILKGKAYVNSYDYSRSERAEEWNDDKTNFKKDFFSDKNSVIKIDSIHVENIDKDSLPLEQTVDFSMPVNSSGNYMYFNTNLFTGLDDNPFVAKRRFSDIDFGFIQSYTFTGVYTLPAGYTLQALPKNMMMIMPDTSIVYTRIMQAVGQNLSIRFTVTFKKPVYTPDEYPALQDFYKKLFAKLNEQIVLEKNN
jgi:Domain of Unknown Function with PDB structure (DUF3857)/Transglutaminase-like superfamily